MKTLSASTETAFDSPHTAPVCLVEIKISTTTLFLCDRVFGATGAECVFDSELYEPLVISWSVNAGVIDAFTNQTEPSQASISVDDTAGVGGFSRLSEMFNTLIAQFATVTISIIPDTGAAGADAVVVFKGSIEDPGISEHGVLRLRCTGIELDVSKQFAHEILNDTTYAGADPDDLGKMLPQAYGSCKRVPFLAVDVGAQTTLTTDIAYDATTITVTDSTGFPSSGTIQIESEKITFTGNSSNQFTGCTRGASSTVALPHVGGAGVAEVQTEYFYAIGHAVKAFDAVYVSNVKQSGNYTAYTGQPGDQHATYGAKAVIKFTSDKIGRKLWHNQLVYSAHEFHSTDGNIGDVYQITGNETNSFTLTVSGGVWAPTFIPARSIDGYGIDWHVSVTVADLGTTGRMYVEVYDSNDASWRRIFEIEDGVVTISGTNPYPVYVSGSNYPVLLQFKMNGESSGAGAFDGDVSVDLYGVTMTCFRYAEDPTGGVAFTGNSTADTPIGGGVSADIQGFQDDGSGTYTGTPAALIERPDHILRHLLIDRCGLTSSEIDAASYTASGSRYASNTIVLGVCLLQKPNVRMLLSRIAHQAKSIEVFEGGAHKLIYIDENPASAADIGQNRVDLGQIWYKYTLRAGLENRLSARFNHYWAGYDKEIDSDREVIVASDAGSIALIGALEGEVRSYPYITASAQAEIVLNWELNDRLKPRLLIEFAGGMDLLAYERGDVIRIAAESGDFLDEALSGVLNDTAFADTDDTAFSETDDAAFLDTISSRVFRVVNQQYRPGTVQLETIEVIQ